MVVCSTVIAKLTSELKSGKSSGPDDISLDTLKFANNRLTVVLSLYFSMCLSHGCIPPHMIKTTIVPIGKNKCGKLSESNNYYNQARQTRPNSGGVAEGQPRFDKGGVAIIFYFLRVKNIAF